VTPLAAFVTVILALAKGEPLAVRTGRRALLSG
jgi:hypothetical protein